MGLASQTPVAILMMAYGSPDSLDEMEAYLLDVRGGRPTPAALVEEIKHRYALIGGRSPLLEQTRKQAAALQVALNSRIPANHPGFRTYVGMRHWQPRIAASVAAIAQDGISSVIALVMAPHSSHMSTGAYFSKLNEAIATLALDLQVIPIKSWHNHPGLIKAIAEHSRQAFRLFKPVLPYVIFTAHSLPQRILGQGDPYDAQLKETAQLVAERLKLPAGRWEFCYQSAGQSPEPWLGPQIEEVVVRITRAGERDLLVVPIGFVCDHVEVLYDIDIAAKELATRQGAHLERSASLNDSPVFIDALADLVLTRLSKEPSLAQASRRGG